MGMGPVEGMVVMEELGRGIVLEPLAPDADRRRHAGRLCAASPEGRMAAQDRGRRGPGGAGAAGTQGPLSAGRLRDAGQRIGRQPGPSAAPRASCRRATRPTPSWCRPRRTARSPCSLWSAQASGVTTRGYGTQEGGRAAEVTFKAAPAALVTLDGLTALEHAVDIGIAAGCAEAVGVLDKTMDVTVEYMNTRKQFGVTLVHLPGTAPSRGRHEDAAGAGALHELLRRAQAERPGRGAAPRHGPRQVPGSACPCASSARTRCSCTAASA